MDASQIIRFRQELDLEGRRGGRKRTHNHPERDEEDKSEDILGPSHLHPNR